MFNPLRPSDAYMRHETKPSLIQIVACRLASASHHLKQCGIMWIGPWGTNFNNILVEIHHFPSRKCVWICRLQKKKKKKIADNLSRPHCVNSLVTISTTIKFGKRSDELILMIGDLISFSHTRWRHSCHRLYSLRYPLGFQWSPSTCNRKPMDIPQVHCRLNSLIGMRSLCLEVLDMKLMEQHDVLNGYLYSFLDFIYGTYPLKTYMAGLKYIFVLDALVALFMFMMNSISAFIYA